jgi:hypothetical protein
MEFGSQVGFTKTRALFHGRIRMGSSISGVHRVRNAILPWIAKGYLMGEKADQYFEAVAKFRRARRVFQPVEPRHHGRERQSL